MLSLPTRASTASTPAGRLSTALLAALVGLCLLVSTPATAADVTHAGIVSDDPANWTPNVMDGQVNAVARIGNTVYVAGDFSEVHEPRGPRRELRRDNIFAFDVLTREVITAFDPVVDGPVRSIVADPATSTIYLAGAFRQVNGANSRSLAAIDAQSGVSRAGFVAPGLDAPVNDVHLRQGTLLIGGPFTHVGQTERPALASIDAATGDVTQYLDARLTTSRTGRVAVVKMAVSPDGKLMVAVGNFSSALGRERHQIAMFELQTSTASLADWTTPRYTSTCSPGFDTYMRDLDFSPDGSFFVVTTTGGYRRPPAMCDTQARFETIATQRDADPTWISYTGGDTTYAASITGPAVYVGGHFRWMNNPDGSGTAGPGAVPRSGLAALDPRNGIPLSWDPGRTRGVGVFDMLATTDGLWITSDTDRVNDERHGRIAYFPLLGGGDMPPEKTGSLPGDVFLLGNRTSDGNRTLTRWAHMDGGPGAPSDATKIKGSESWRDARGGVLIDDHLYSGWSDGSFTRRTVDGATFGEPTSINLYGGTFADDIPRITGMFYDKARGRLYYTMSGSRALHWRGFSPQSSVVGATRFVVARSETALPAHRVAGMFLHGSTLYFGHRLTGQLKSVEFADGRTRGPVTVVNSSINWRSYASFISSSEPGASPYLPPSAVIAASSCTYSACQFDGSDSRTQGSGMRLDWDFGDGTSGVGVSATHTYQESGVYPVTLTVTDRLGGRDSTQTQVTVTAPPQPVVVKVESREAQTVLHVNVNPNVGEKSWTFLVEKRRDGQWVPRKTYETEGPAETRRIDLRRGKFRVVVQPDHGRLGATSAAVRLIG